MGPELLLCCKKSEMVKFAFIFKVLPTVGKRTPQTAGIGLTRVFQASTLNLLTRTKFSGIVKESVPLTFREKAVFSFLLLSMKPGRRTSVHSGPRHFPSKTPYGGAQGETCAIIPDCA
jgi:hypothetical protein